MNQRVSKATSASPRTRSPAQVFRRSPWLFPLLGLLVGGFCSALVVSAALIYNSNPQLAGFLPRISSLFSKATPGPDCGGPTLTLGATSLPIKPLDLAPDGSINVPADTPGVAYWVAGTETNYIFALSPTPDNLAFLTPLKSDDEATIVWKNCNSTKYILSGPEQAVPDDTALLDQSISGVTVFLRNGSTSMGLILRGELVGEHLEVITTPAPDAAGVQAEVELLETKASPDQATLSMGVSIYNYGGSAFTVSTSDVSLTPENGLPLALISADPALPVEIRPGESKTIYITFQRPPTAIAVFRIFEIEYDLEGY